MKLIDTVRNVASSKTTGVAGLLAGATALNQGQAEAALVLILVSIGFLQTSLGPKADWVETTRDKYWLKLHEALSIVGSYSVLETDKAEYVATVSIGEEEFEEVLYRNGFHRNLVAAKKYRMLPSGIKQYSLASWVTRESLLSTMQNHVTVYPGDKVDELHLYNHYEYSWITHPVKHYKGADQQDGDVKGVVSEMLKKEDVEYYVDERFKNGQY